MLEKARLFALEAHAEQKYGDQPYIVHLEAVVAHLHAYSDEAKIVGYLHDVVEDTNVSVTDIENSFGLFIAECVAIVTDEPGTNRRERKQKTYAKMAKVSGKTQLALVVKAADRLANLDACVANNNTNKLLMYKSEHPAFQQAVYRQGLCDDLWLKIDDIIKIQ